MVKKVGNNNNNTLDGTSGDDLLIGKGGNDILNGLDGNDRLLGGDGKDKLFGGDGDDKLVGGAGADTLYGGAGLNSTDEGGRLRGGSGLDTLNMEYGNTKAWLQNGQGYDKIDGFIEGEDMLFIKLSNFGLGNSFDTSEITNSATATATSAAAQFIYETDTNYLWFDSNGTTAGGLTLVAAFENEVLTGNDLGTNDFEFIL